MIVNRPTLEAPPARKAPQLPFAWEELESSIPARFRRVLRNVADHPAILTAERQMSYQALEDASDRVAHTLITDGAGGSGVIACLLEPGVELVIAILGILKTGKAYTALHLQNPVARLQEMTAFAEARTVLSTGAHTDLVTHLLPEDGTFVKLEALGVSQASYAVPPISGDDGAMLCFTSGTTGKPKAVLFTHKNFLHRVWHNFYDYSITPDDRIAMLGFPGFGGPARDLMIALSSGATLVPIDSSRVSTQQLIAQLRSLRVTHVHTGAALIRQLLDAIDSFRDLPDLRLLVAGGQALLPADVTLFREKFGEHCTLVHRLSASECGQVAQYFVPPTGEFQDGIVPVGSATQDKEILLLDDNHQPVPFGEVGEIAVRSHFLAPGYWRDPALTARVFLPDLEGGSRRIYLTRDLGRFRPDGLLQHLGRKEQRVRIRGYTVELTAVEAALRTLANVRQAVVLEDVPRPGENRLVAFIEPIQPPGPSASALRGMLGAIVPDYMIPNLFIALEKMPFLPNGKIDRRSLPALSSARPALDGEYVPARTPYEAQLCAIWAELLGLESVGVHDSFLDLGGHSLLATQIVTRVLERFQVLLPLQALFRAPTVADMARLILDYQLRQLDAEELDLWLAATTPGAPDGGR